MRTHLVRSCRESPRGKIRYFFPEGGNPARTSRFAFSLVELLAVTAIVGILAALATTGASAISETSNRTQSLVLLRGIGNASQLYSNDNDGELPKSQQQRASWVTSLAPYLGLSDNPSDSDHGWREICWKIIWRGSGEATHARRYRRIFWRIRVRIGALGPANDKKLREGNCVPTSSLMPYDPATKCLFF